MSSRFRLARRSASRKGYTMVEVMMGLSILAIGSVSILGLQKFAAMGTMSSRHITNASAISGGVLEAMNAESLSWVDNAAPDVTERNAMPWLGAALFAADAEVEGAWASPTVTLPAAGTFNAFTLEGVAQDSDTVLPTTAYCTHVRATWLGRQNPTGPGVGDDATAVRVDVRTFWAKSGRSVADECNGTTFSTANLNNLLENTAINSLVPVSGIDRHRDNYGVVYFTTIIRRPST
jgi:prepilin-type N-terminal cleavage/methylation domain-containing protein